MRLSVGVRANGIPITTHGAWSPIYTATTTAQADAPLSLVGTVSESFSDGSASSSAHKLMPGFVWTGNQDPLSGVKASLFRVEVFTDSSCLNRVWTGAAVPSPAYAPRLFGGGDGGADYTLDGDSLAPNESLVAATPTTSAPGSKDKISTTDAASIGAPVDLWDQNWPSSGYYWIVMPVAAINGGLYDMELAQDMCAGGFFQRVGISSQPTPTTAGGSAYASGLSAAGRLVSASHTAKFYGQPLVAWEPAANATAYELQWSKKAYPFRPVGTRLTLATSLVLNLKPGTWYYRVRGYDYNLPTGAQSMGWSDQVKIIVAAPKFRVVG
jgi:hypothetical protein